MRYSWDNYESLQFYIEEHYSKIVPQFEDTFFIDLWMSSHFALLYILRSVETFRPLLCKEKKRNQ